MKLAYLVFPTLPLLAACQSAVPAVPAGILAGGYARAPLDDPQVLAARNFLQKHLAVLKLDVVQEAWTQVVAGTNVKLVCRVSGEGRPALWEFVAWHKLDGTWQWTSARKLSELI